MDSLKEKDNPAPNPAKRPRIEVDEELMRQMIAGQAPLDSEVVRRIPEPEEEDTNALEENTSETVSGASAPTAEKTDVDTQTTTGKESAGFRRKKIALPDFERTFFAPVDCRNRSAIYVSAQTKHKVSEILHLLGNENTRLTALVDNMLRFVMNIYSDELNYLHEKKNSRRPFRKSGGISTADSRTGGGRRTDRPIAAEHQTRIVRSYRMSPIPTVEF